MWTRDEFFDLLSRNDQAVGRALLSLLEEQTHDEREMMDTKHVNGRGFTPPDAKVMTSMAMQFRRKGWLSERQLAWLRSGKSTRYPSRIGKYAAQLARKVNARYETLKAQLEELQSRCQHQGTHAQISRIQEDLRRITPPSLREVA